VRWPRGAAEGDAARGTTTGAPLGLVPEASPEPSDLASFVAAHYARLLGTAGLICLDIATAETIVQRALRQAWGRRGPRRAAARTRRALDQTVARAALHPRGVAGGGGYLGRFVLAPRVVPLRVAGGPADGLATLAGAFEALTARQRALLSLVYVSGYSLAEATQLLGLRRGAGHGALQVGRERLRRALGGGAAGAIPEDQLDLTIERCLAERAAEIVRYALPLVPTTHLLAPPLRRRVRASRAPEGSRNRGRWELRSVGWRRLAVIGVAALAASLAVGYLVVGPYRPAVGGYMRTLRSVFSVAWSPDGSQLAFTVEVPHPLGPQDVDTAFDLYVVDASGGGLRRLRAGLPATLDPRWSPSGRELLIPAGSPPRQDRFEVLDVSSGISRVMPSPDGSSFDPRWSPDGTRILFTVGRAWSEEQGWWARQDQWLVNADGSDLRNLSRNGAAVAGAWSPDGRYIAFTTQSDGGGSEMLVAADGSQLRRIGDCCDATWIDDSHLRLTKWVDQGLLTSIVPTDGGPTVSLDTSQIDRTWSPDGRLYATLGSDATLKVMTMGGEPAWTDEQGFSTNGPLVWTPDSRAIAFVGKDPDSEAGLYVLQLPDGKPRLALRYVSSWAAIAWRPGQAADAPTELALAQGADIVAIRSDGTSSRVLARAPSPDDPPGTPYLPGGRTDRYSLPTSMSIDGHGPNAVAYDVRLERMWVTNGSAAPWVIHLASDGFFECPDAEGATSVQSDWGDPACRIMPGAGVELSIGGSLTGDGGALVLQLEPGMTFDERRPIDVYLRLIPPDSGPPVSASRSP